VKLKYAGDILAGLVYLAKHNIYHGDLKPANILVTKEKDGTVVAHIADFGGAHELITDHTETNLHTGSFTHQYASIAHFKAAAKLLRRQALRPTQTSPQGGAFIDRDPNRSNQILMGNDVFAAGIILYELFAGVHPFELKGATSYQQSFPDLQTFKGIDLLKEKGVSNGIIALIKEMVGHDPNKPISIEEIAARFEKAVAERQSTSNNA